MNVFIGIVGIVLFLIGFTLALIRRENKTMTVAMVVVGLCLFVIGNSFTIIPTGYTGVKSTFGQINSKTLQNGLNWKAPFVQSIEKVNNKQQDYEHKDKIWGESSERTAVYAAQVTITYKINSDKSAWIYANVSNYKNSLIPDDLVASSVKTAMVQLDSTHVTQRSSIEPLAKEEVIKALNEKYGDNVITVLKVTINDMDFEDSYNQAIATKQQAMIEAETQAVQNKKNIEKAEADKQVTIKNAEAAAEAKRIDRTAWRGRAPPAPGSCTSWQSRRALRPQSSWRNPDTDRRNKIPC